MFPPSSPCAGVAMKIPQYEIFSGRADRDAVWLEAVDGLGPAVDRMKDYATQSPGSYFVFCRNTHALLASIDTLKGRRVVLADDFSPMLMEVAKLLRGSFEIVGTVGDGRSAFETIMALNPDLVVLDISMPGVNGIEVASELKKRGNSAKIVFLTSHKDPTVRESCLDVGGLGCVDKLRMHKDLVPALNEALAGRVFVSRHSQPVQRHSYG